MPAASSLARSASTLPRAWRRTTVPTLGDGSARPGHGRQDDGQVEIGPPQHVGVGGGAHAAVDVGLAVDVHRAEVAGDGARRGHRRRQPGRQVPAHDDPAQVVLAHGAHPQRGVGPGRAQDLLQRPGAARPGPAVPSGMTLATAVTGSSRHGRRSQAVTRAAGQPGRPDEQRGQPDRGELGSLAQGPHHARRAGPGLGPTAMVARSGGGDAPAQQGAHHRAGRGPHHDVGRAGVPAQVVLQGRQRAAWYAMPTTPPPPEDEADLMGPVAAELHQQPVGVADVDRLGLAPAPQRGPWSTTSRLGGQPVWWVGARPRSRCGRGGRPSAGSPRPGTTSMSVASSMRSEGKSTSPRRHSSTRSPASPAWRPYQSSVRSTSSTTSTRWSSPEGRAAMGPWPRRFIKPGRGPRRGPR